MLCIIDEFELLGNISNFEGDNFRKWKFKIFCALPDKGVLTEVCSEGSAAEAMKLYQSRPLKCLSFRHTSLSVIDEC